MSASPPRDENRRKFPETAMLVDMFRAAGASVKVAYAREGENEVGRRDRFDEWEKAAPYARHIEPRRRR